MKEESFWSKDSGTHTLADTTLYQPETSWRQEEAGLGRCDEKYRRAVKVTANISAACGRSTSIADREITEKQPSLRQRTWKTEFGFSLEQIWPLTRFRHTALSRAGLFLKYQEGEAGRE